MIKILLRIWEMLAWIEVCRYVVSTAFSRLLGQPQPPLPQLFGSSNSFSPVKFSFYPSSKFTFVELIEANWSVILSELKQLDDKHYFPWREEFSREDSELFALYLHGIKIEENCRLCPQTTHLMERIPDLVTAGFSVLAPGTHTVFSTKFIADRLHCHLGLVTPDQCGIQIEESCQTWHEGKCLIFDNAVNHQMWNWSDSPRVVLLIDFKAPAELLL
jgi:ornithine lipid ester-linked acyl 2-hydroxylase